MDSEALMLQEIIQLLKELLASNNRIESLLEKNLRETPINPTISQKIFENTPMLDISAFTKLDYGLQQILIVMNQLGGKTTSNTLQKILGRDQDEIQLVLNELLAKNILKSRNGNINNGKDPDMVYYFY